MIGDIFDFTLDETLRMYTNGGLKNFTQMAPFNFLPMEVHFNQDSTDNILSIKDVVSIQGVNINMDSNKEHAIIAEYKNKNIKFQECRDGLYYYDTDNKFTPHVNSYYFLSAVKDNKEYFSTSDIQRSVEARKLQQEIGWKTTSHFKDVISKKLLCNCKVIVDNISRSEISYGSPAPILQGKKLGSYQKAIRLKEYYCHYLYLNTTRTYNCTLDYFL